VKLVAVVATLGRDKELTVLFDSLRLQSRPVDEIVVVDQNHDNRVKDVLETYRDLPITHVHDPDLVGVNRSRNHGWQHATGDVFFFPDDDCWYPAETCETVLAHIRTHKADIVSGRAAAMDGRTINGKFDDQPGWVTRTSAWFSQIEWIFFISRPALEATGGFDEAIGPGSGTNWGANEVQDLSLAAMTQGFHQYYDPNLIAHHEEIKLDNVSAGDFKRLAKYARGFGYVLGKHSYGYKSLLWWSLRPVAGALVSLTRANPKHALLQLRMSSERFLGYFEGRRHLEEQK